MDKMSRLKWKTLCLLFIFVSVKVECYPIKEVVEVEEIQFPFLSETILPDETSFKEHETIVELDDHLNNATVANHEAFRANDLNPGQKATSYEVDINIDGGTFEGSVVIRVELEDDARENSIKLHCEDLDVDSVEFVLNSGSDFRPIDEFSIDSGVLEITPPTESWLFYFRIKYSGVVRSDGNGIYRRHYDDDSYLAMNLHPTHARRVFPCLDEPTESSLISFNFNNEEHREIIGNSINEGDDDEAEFKKLQSPTHLWGMVAHNFISVNVMGDRLRLSGRVHNQGAYAQIMMQEIFTFLDEWTDKPFDEIDEAQNGHLHVFAMPDITRDWYALSTIAIWEPHVLMEDDHSIKQQIIALRAMAEGFARQWFGYVIYPQNWKYSWVTEGLGAYAAYKAAEVDTRLDSESIFLTDVMHESMMRDSFSDSQVLEPEDFMFDEQEIRDHLNGILKYKAPAVFQTLNLVLSHEDDEEEEDFIKIAARNLINSRGLRNVNDNHFYDALNSVWFFTDGDIKVIDFMDPWIHNTGYPVINVDIRSGGLFLTQVRFGFTARDSVIYDIPITYTTSKDPDFEDIDLHSIMGATEMFDINLDEDDWIIFNVQGKGYYRVNYHEDLWGNLIGVLEDEEDREEIHELSRAMLLDDALNLARAGLLDYDIALTMVLTMELEVKYAPWKTFVRNMDFLRKQLLAYVAEDDDEELDPDIYLRMVRRTIETLEEELGFYPDRFTNEEDMETRTRGLVMEHACRAEYEPCISAAYDWFYDEEGDLNDEIPTEIRPAVYCTIVRKGDEDDIEALSEQMEEEDSLYERIVILQSFACSEDKDFVLDLLEETLDDEEGRFGVEERSLFFEAVAESSVQNAELALLFIRLHLDNIRDKYGGPDRLERIIHTLADNLVTEDLVDIFSTWVDGMTSNLEESRDSARRALEKAKENLHWRNNYLEEVYEWIDENDSCTVSVSIFMLLIMAIIHIFNFNH